MKNIATGGVLERIRKLAPQHVTAPYRTVDEWREWQLAEGQVAGGKNSESLRHPAVAPQVLVCELPGAE
ncbi:replication protein [Escherichia coli]|nr:replication protein [Escherichia coli]